MEKHKRRGIERTSIVRTKFCSPTLTQWIPQHSMAWLEKAVKQNLWMLINTTSQHLRIRSQCVKEMRNRSPVKNITDHKICAYVQVCLWSCVFVYMAELAKCM